MKKAQMFLTVIAAVAVVGGALAFKAQSRDGVKYCTSTSTVSNASCPNFLGNGTITGGTTFVGYKVITGTTCDNVLCTSTGKVISEN